MSIKIIVDSAADIMPNEAKELGIIHMPLRVMFGENEYKDAVEITHEQFYEMLIESDKLPTTSQIPPSDYVDVIEEIKDSYDSILIITMSSELSGTYQSACIAAADYPGKVFVVDSHNVSLGERLLVEHAVRLADKGVSIEEIVKTLNEERSSIRLIAVLNTLEYLKKGGRISAVTAFTGEVLSIKPVIAIVEGKVELIGKARGSKNVNNFLRKCVEDCVGIDFSRPYCSAYSGLSDHMLQKYISDSADLWRGEVEELPIHTVGAVIGTYAGPGAIAVAFFEKDN